jgi:hypothetical protein
LTDPQKREVLLHLSREKKIEFQERIYNQHVRLLSPSPGWLAPSKSTRGWEPTLLWNAVTLRTPVPGILSVTGFNNSWSANILSPAIVPAVTNPNNCFGDGSQWH